MSLPMIARRSVSSVAVRSCVCHRIAIPMRRLHQTALRRDFGWNKLVTPLTNPAFIARMKELDNKFQSMKTEIFGVPEKIEAVDWSSFEKQIQNKALFQQIKKEYETMTFPAVKGEDLSEINRALDTSIQKATVAAEISKQELPKLRALLQQAIQEKKDVHTWELDEYFRRYPGLEEQLREEYMNGEYLASDAEERLDALDIAEARKAFKTGAELPIPDGVPDQVGNYSAKDEAKQIESLLDKMYGGNAQYEALKRADKAAEAKRAAVASHH